MGEKEELNPRTTEREFCGWPGALAISTLLPVLFNVLYFSCNERGCPVTWDSLDPYWDMWEKAKLVSWEAAGVYLAWFFSLVVLDRIVPGAEVDGTVLRDGTRLKYKFNGTNIVIILFSVLGARAIQTQLALPELVFVYEHLLELLNVSLLFSVAMAVFVYVRSFLHSKEPILALGGNSGNPIFDWFIGRELNPRIGDFDIKIFCEMRPGLLLWIIINLSMMHHQWLKFGYVSDSMILVNVFQNWYVIEGTFYEQGLVGMMDIIMDGFGFMLSMGDHTLVPFTHTMQARYLADNPVDLGYLGIAGILVVYFTGIAIFRLSNNQKNDFKQGNAKAAHLKYISTPTGSKLITSGWWGTARHINYFGDWIVAWAYSLPTGFNTPIPYYFIVWFAILLIHRERRDEAKCAKKYGETWKEYKRLVPYRIIPGVY